MAEEVPGQLELIHTCGWPEDSFACKIRHLQINTGDAKADRERYEYDRSNGVVEV